jgi:hypothetical protein
MHAVYIPTLMHELNLYIYLAALHCTFVLFIALLASRQADGILARGLIRATGLRAFTFSNKL